MPDETVITHGWDPDQYSKFAAERTKPFLDLLAMVEPVPGGDVIDLGCGTGELTARLHAYTKAGATVGIDASEAMLTKAGPLAGNGLRFELRDISRFDAGSSFDVVFANASLQWVPDHPRLLRQLAASCAPEVSSPFRFPPTPTTLPMPSPSSWRRKPLSWSTWVPTRPLRRTWCAPERYAEVLDDIGFSDQLVRLQVYGHHLASSAAVVEWTKGTTLLRFKSLACTGPVRAVHGALPATARRGARRARTVLLHLQTHPVLGTACRPAVTPTGGKKRSSSGRSFLVERAARYQRPR